MAYLFITRWILAQVPYDILFSNWIFWKGEFASSNGKFCSREAHFFVNQGCLLFGELDIFPYTPLRKRLNDYWANNIHLSKIESPQNASRKYSTQHNSSLSLFFWKILKSEIVYFSYWGYFLNLIERDEEFHIIFS